MGGSIQRFSPRKLDYRGAEQNPSLSDMGGGFINWGYTVVGGNRRWIIGRYFHTLGVAIIFSTPSFIWCFERLSLRLHGLPHHLLHRVGEIALVDDPVQVFPIQSSYFLQLNFDYCPIRQVLSQRSQFHDDGGPFHIRLTFKNAV